MRENKTLFILTLVIFLSVFLLFLAPFLSQKKEAEDLRQDLLSASLQDLEKAEVVYIINKGGGEISAYNMAGISERETVFSLLERTAADNSFSFNVKQYDFGVLIEEIGGLKNGDNNKYWQYWVNDVLGEVAADKKEIKAGDRVEWRFDIVPEF